MGCNEIKIKRMADVAILMKMINREKMQKKGKITKESKNLRRYEDVDPRAHGEVLFSAVAEGGKNRTNAGRVRIG